MIGNPESADLETKGNTPAPDSDHFLTAEETAAHNAEFTYKVWIEVEAFDAEGNSDESQSEYATWETGVTGVGDLTWDEAMTLARATEKWMDANAGGPSPETGAAPTAGPLAAAVDRALNLMVEHFNEVNYSRGWSSAELDAATGGAWTVLLEAYEEARRK